MWTPTTRKQHNRKTDRYQSDLTDEEWRVIEPHLPAATGTGRPRTWSMREVVNGIFYVMRAGCPWRLLPSYFPPWETVYRWFAAWRDDGRFETINHALVMADRERAGREASPTGAIIDSQSVKTTEAGGPRGYHAGKKINGRKRHALVDTDGRALVIEPRMLQQLRYHLNLQIQIVVLRLSHVPEEASFSYTRNYPRTYRNVGNIFRA